MSAYALNRAPNLSTVSPYLWKTLSRSVREKTTIIPNFIGGNLWTRTVPPSARGRYVITVCNGFSRRKNLANGLLGFRQALSSIKDVQFLLVGSGCEPGGPVHRFCEESGCLDNVVFAGPAPYGKVLDLVGNAMLMLHPSYEESFGMSVLEAMALGTPVIAGDRSGNMPHLIKHGETGHLCDIRKPDSIAAALRALCADDSLRAEIGLAASRHAAETYSASVVVGQYLEAYRRILSGHPAALEACLCN
jgi:glycosyltransferase involved in cell wall biosynthesis